MTKEEFIQKANKIHDTKYSYSNVKYTNRKTKIEIICHIHGEFSQRPYAHLYGQGCPQCGEINAKLKKLDNNDSFIKKAKNIHGDRYDYSKVRYINSSSNIKIICHIHGEFSQRPHNHLSGYGCKKCNCNGGYSLSYFNKSNKLWFERRFKYGYIYLKKFQNVNEEFYKIGISAAKERNFKTKGKYKITQIYDIKCYIYDAYIFEQVLLKYLKNNNEMYYPKYNFSGATECFKLDTKSMKKLIKQFDKAKSEMILYYSQADVNIFKTLNKE